MYVRFEHLLEYNGRPRRPAPFAIWSTARIIPLFMHVESFGTRSSLPEARRLPQELGLTSEEAISCPTLHHSFDVGRDEFYNAFAAQTISGWQDI